MPVVGKLILKGGLHVTSTGVSKKHKKKKTQQKELTEEDRLAREEQSALRGSSSRPVWRCLLRVEACVRVSKWVSKSECLTKSHSPPQGRPRPYLCREMALMRKSLRWRWRRLSRARRRTRLGEAHSVLHQKFSMVRRRWSQLEAPSWCPWMDLCSADLEGACQTVVQLRSGDGSREIFSNAGYTTKVKGSTAEERLDIRSAMKSDKVWEASFGVCFVALLCPGTNLGVEPCFVCWWFRRSCAAPGYRVQPMVYDIAAIHLICSFASDLAREVFDLQRGLKCHLRRFSLHPASLLPPTWATPACRNACPQI